MCPQPLNCLIAAQAHPPPACTLRTGRHGGRSSRQPSTCPANRTDPAVVTQVCNLAGPDGKYHDFNICHLHDLLEEYEHIEIGRSTLDRLLRQNGLRQAAHPPSVHRRRRTRRSAEGMLVQMDGSPHAWLGRNRALASRFTALSTMPPAESWQATSAPRKTRSATFC